MRSSLVLPLLVAAGTTLAASTAAIDARLRPKLDQIQHDVSSAEMQKTLDAFSKLTRVSGSPDEARAADFLETALKRYGVSYTRLEIPGYLSWPVRATVRVIRPEGRTIGADTIAFSGTTPPGGMSGEAVFISLLEARMMPAEREALGAKVSAKIVVLDGITEPDSSRTMEDLGAVALVNIDPTEYPHRGIATTVWGTPTPATAALVPRMATVTIKRSDGEMLKALAAKGPVSLAVEAELSTAWRTMPLIVAQIRGATEDFVMVTTHIDSWDTGMTDTAGTDAGVLEMARLLAPHAADLRRGFRFAWWPGHSTGRYAGSTWYVDHFWSELNAHCVAYTNLDGSGRRGSQLDKVRAGGYPELDGFSREFARELTGLSPEQPPNPLFRPGRDSDSSFQGLGVPALFIGTGGLLSDSPDRMGRGGVWYWHTPEDTIDKIDMKVLIRDTQLRVAQLLALGTRPVLPIKSAPIAREFMAALDTIAGDGGTHFDLSSTRVRATRLAGTAERLDAAVEAAGDAGADRANRVLREVSHRLNGALYTYSGRFDQDRAGFDPLLPRLARVPDLAALDPKSNDYGFLETALTRGRNAVDAALDEAIDLIEEYLAGAQQTYRR